MPAMMVALAAVAVLQAASGTGITRTVLNTTPTMEAARVEYRPGAAEPPENHGYDVVLVPVDEGMTAELEGAAVRWTPGVPILVSRGAPHRLTNRSDHRVRFVEVRTIGDNAAGTDQAVSATGATIARSVYDKYIRATVWRYERGARVEWPASVDALIVHAAAPGTVLANPHAVDAAAEAEVVRVSRMASR